MSADAGIYSLSGQAATLEFERLFNAQAGAYSVTGQDAEFARTAVMPADAGAYAINGQSATLSIIRQYPLPEDVRDGVQYGPGGIYVGTMPPDSRVPIRSFTGSF